MGELKAALRKELATRRNALPDREAKSRAIEKQVLALPEYLQAERLLLYLSTGSEVDTWGGSRIQRFVPFWRSRPAPFAWYPGWPLTRLVTGWAMEKDIMTAFWRPMP